MLLEVSLNPSCNVPSIQSSTQAHFDFEASTMVYLPLAPAPSFLLYKPHSHSHPIKRANPAPPTTTTTPTPTPKAKMLVRSISLPELGFRPSAPSLPPLNGGHDRHPASAPPGPHPGNDFEELEEEE
jgi:hypothetical protein